MLAQTHPLTTNLSAIKKTLPSQNTQSLIKNLQEICHSDLVQLNHIILTHLEQRVPLIGDIAKHLILAGGKRLRPLLSLACCRTLGETPSHKMVELAASIEFIHSATLLHDDVVDVSPLRRGRPTANALWGNKPTILVGDFLFAKAFELMLGDNEKRVLPILAKVSQTITEGEVFQLSYLKTFSLDETVLLRIIGSKTAALFAASCEISAALFNRSCDVQEALHHFGYNLGMAFQIIDDLLDYVGETESLGKSMGDDLKEGKVTVPLFLAYQEGSLKERGILESMIARAGVTIDETLDPSDLDTALHIMHRTGAIQKSYDKAWTYAKKAIDALSPVNESPIKRILSDLCYSLVIRTS